MKIAHATFLSIVVSMALMASTDRAVGAISDHTDPSFCAPSEPVRDFGMSRLPPLPEVPESAKRLGFGAVSMYTMHGGWSRVMPEPLPFGYGFAESNYNGVVPLNWTVTAQLWTVDRRGRELHEVDRAKLLIGRLNSAHQPNIEVQPPENRTGFYRFDMQIANKGGVVIGSYGAYFKVVRPSWKPKLQLAPAALRPGDILQIRVENHGSEIVSHRESFRIQRFENGAWTSAPGLVRGRWRMWLGFIDPGRTGRCNSLSLPADTPPGLYRVVKGVGTQLWPEGRQAQLTAPFEVLAPDAPID